MFKGLFKLLGIFVLFLAFTPSVFASETGMSSLTTGLDILGVLMTAFLAGMYKDKNQGTRILGDRIIRFSGHFSLVINHLKKRIILS